MPSPLNTGSSDWRPNLFVPGFLKCGTTALCDYLRQHPDIYFMEPKEPNTLAIGIQFPSWRKKHNRIMRPYSAYMNPGMYKREFERRLGFRYRGEGSQSYIWPPHFPQRLKDFAPEAKLLFMVREQKERLLSLYFYGFDVHLEPEFARWTEKRFRPQARFFLFEQVLKSYYGLFGDSMRVIDNDALSKSPQTVMRDVFGFLGLRQVEVAPLRSNVSGMRGLSEAQRRRVAPFLRVKNTVMTPVQYLLNMTDQGGKVRVRIPLGTLNPIKRIGRLATPRGRPGGRSRGRPFKEKMETPEDLAMLLDEDYESTLEFCRARGLLLGRDQGLQAR